MKHGQAYNQAIADSTSGLTAFPAASEVTPVRLLQLVALCDPRNNRHEAPYYEWSAIRDLVYTLMREWGWQVPAQASTSLEDS